MLEKKFDVRLDPDALKEYSKLDNSVLPVVNKAIDELEYRADEVGKPLGNKSSSKLAGCKEIKLREVGIRIVFRITSEKVEVLRIVYVLAIEERSKDFVFKIAHERFKKLKSLTKRAASKNIKEVKKVGCRKAIGNILVLLFLLHSLGYASLIEGLRHWVRHLCVLILLM